MARSIRSKVRQRTLSHRRKKFGEREVLKAWEHYHKINRGKVENMHEDSIGTKEQSKISKKEISKWASRNQKKKQQRFRRKKERTKAKARAKAHSSKNNQEKMEE